MRMSMRLEQRERNPKLLAAPVGLVHEWFVFVLRMSLPTVGLIP